MSYCRFSSDDWQCDVYVYESAVGYETVVAARRHVFKDPLPPPVPFTESTIEAFVARQVKVNRMLDAAELQPIDLPHAGESFIDGDAEACAERLERLRDMGYHVPAYAIGALRAGD